MRLLTPALLLAATATAQDAGVEFFEKNVRPLFASKCYGCHGEKMKMGGLSLSSAAGLEHALQSGIVSKGDAEKSRMYRALLYSESIKMPPAGKLSTEEIAAVRTWIEGGAALPNASPVSSKSSGVTAQDRSYWAFQPLKTAEPSADKSVNPIDNFIRAKLSEKRLDLAPAAPKLTLLRRVTYDLTGLPPTKDEIRDFLNDRSPDGFAKVVDRLLASPRYGERWGRHWLDVARYADSTGMDEDNLYPHAWRYRDYVVDAFNKDTPFNEFVKQQLAGDLLPAANSAERARNVIATGFLAIGPRPLAQQDRMQMIYDVVDEQIDTTTKTFLGLTVACARCHDHKLDPIPTKDYYGLASIFASTTTFRNQGRPGSISYFHYTPLDPIAYDRYQAHHWRALSKQLEMEHALSEEAQRETAVLRSKLKDILVAAWEVECRKTTVDAAAASRSIEFAHLSRWSKWLTANAKEPYLQKWRSATPETIEGVSQEYADKYLSTAATWDTKLEKWRSRFAEDALQDRDPPGRPTFDAEDDPFFAAATFKDGPMVVAETPRVALLRAEWKQLQDSTPEMPALATAVKDGPSIDQPVFVRGSHHAPGEIVSKHFPVVLAGDTQAAVKGSGRLELAEWLTSSGNPLTPRVIVNRIWQWHFGEALVRTPNNWGRTGEPPTHPELLDYLATRFVNDGWSFKKMHRLILLSNTYRMSSKASKEALETDPGNRLWSRFNRVRMSVEQIRDTMLALDGSLDTTMGGSLFPTGKGKRERIDAEQLKRRTLYIPVRRGNIPALFSTFDFGDATTASDGRTRTNVAPQALFLMNSQFVIDRSRGIASRLMQRTDMSDGDKVREAYLTVLTREPDASEIDSALSYIANLATRLGGSDAALKSWASFCHVLVATNEFLYLE